MAVPRLIPSYTHQDYLQWKGDWELWDGIAVSMSPSPGKSHQRAARKLSFLLQQALERSACEDCELFYELDWVISDTMVIRPDILITCDGQESTFVETCPALVAEILSPSSIERDLVHKRELYSEQGVRYYLVVDPEGFELSVFHLRDGKYEALKQSSSYTLDLGCCGIVLDI